MTDVVSPNRIADSLAEYWSPRVVAELDDSFVKVAKVLGSLTWHSHENEDELFIFSKARWRSKWKTGRSSSMKVRRSSYPKASGTIPSRSKSATSC